MISANDAKRKSRLGLPLGVKVSQQPMHAETGDNEERCEIRQHTSREEPQINLSSGADR